MSKFQLKNIKIKLSILLFLTLIIVGVGFGVNNVQALNEGPVIFTPQVTIPGSEFQQNVDLNLDNSTAPIAKYIKAIYNYGVGIVGIMAALMLMIGGIIWLTAAGSSSKVEQAKSIISSSLIGMVLVLTAFMLLKTINPELVSFKPIKIQIIRESSKLTCCGGPDGIKFFPAEINDKGEYVSPVDHVNLVTCPANMTKIDEKTEICAGDENVYKIIAKGPACGKSGGFCLPFRPDGWADDLNETCPSGLSCEYRDSNVRQKGESCGKTYGATCQYPGSNLHCPPGYEWEVGSGADCGAELYCCYNYKAQENAVKQWDCSKAEAETGASCKTSGGANGFCKDGTCTKCFAYGEFCSSDYKCKDQGGNEAENPDGPCGNNIDGDCTAALGMRCDSNDH